MLANAVLTLRRALLLVVIALSLTATGFAHHMPASQDGTQAGALAFALANGADASDFCGSVPGTERAKSQHCLACQITAGVDLPRPAAQLISLKLAVHQPVTVPRVTHALRSIRDPAHTPQGPPYA